MKRKLSFPLPSHKNALLSLLTLLTVGSTSAAPLYWDANGSTAGAGAAPSGTWGSSSFWNTDSAGGAGTFSTATTSGDTLTFVAGPGTGSGDSNYAVALSSDQSAGGITVNTSGSITLGTTGTTINLGSGGITVSGATGGTISSNIALGADQIFNSARAITFDGAISGAYNLTLSANGIKTFSAANSYSGTTTLNNATNLILQSNGTVGAGAVSLNGTFASLRFNYASDRTFANDVTGTGSSNAITMTGVGGTVTLTGNNTFNGGTNIQSGALKVASISSQLGNTSIIKLGGSITTGSLIYTGSGETTGRTFSLAGTTGGGVIQNDGSSGALIITTGIISASGNKTLTLQGSNTEANELQGVISNTANAVSVKKDGAGKWVLSGANSYSGTTIIDNGTLLINGDHSSATGNVSLNVGTLGGSGTVGGATTAASGTFLAAGDIGSAGNLTFASSLSLTGLTSGTGGLLIDLGSSSDKFTLTSGALTMGTLDFNDFSFAQLSGFGPGAYTLFDTTQTITGSLGTTTGTIGAFNASLSLINSNQDILLTVAVPEPSICILSVMGLFLCSLRRRSNWKV